MKFVRLTFDTVINFSLAYVKSYKSEKQIKKKKIFYVVMWSENDTDFHFKELPASDYITNDKEAEESFVKNYDINNFYYLAIVALEQNDLVVRLSLLGRKI